MDDLEKVCGLFVQEVTTKGGAAVSSIALYGSALGPEFRPGISDYNFAVLAEPISCDLLDALTPLVRRWRKKRISIPLLFTPTAVKSSLDSYPLEFLSIQTRYKILYGDDFLRDLAFAKADVRLQCERELKAKLLLMQRAYLEAEGAPRRLQHLLSRGLPSLVAIFRGMLYLKDASWRLHGADLYNECTRQLDFPQQLLHNLHEVRHRRGAPSREEIRGKMADLLELLQRLALQVDAW